MRTEWVDVAVHDDLMAAYVAHPEDGDGRLVIVCFEMFGVTHYVRTVADRLAQRGFTAVVPDFYHRVGRRIELEADDLGRARGLELLAAVTRDGVAADVDAVVAMFGGAGDAALLGLSVGGHIACYAATQVPVRTLVAFYPGWLTSTAIPLSTPEPTIELAPALARHGTHVLILTGERDHLLDADARTTITAALRDARVDHELIVYPDAPHGFFCDERDSYVADAAADAWHRTLDALRAG